MGDEQFRCGRMSPCRFVQRCFAVPIPRIDIGAVSDEQFHCLRKASIKGRDMQWYVAVIVPRVDIGAVGNEQFHYSVMA